MYIDERKPMPYNRSEFFADIKLTLFLIGCLVIFMWLCSGCQAYTPPPSSLPQATNSILGAENNVKAATTQISAAIPYTTATGAIHLKAATGLDNAAVTQLVTASKQVQTAQTQYQQVSRAYTQEKAELEKAESFWGYRFGKMLDGLILLFVILTAVHYILIGLTPIFPLGGVIAGFLNPISLLLKLF